MELIKACIRRCDDGHRDCKNPIQTAARLPTRLLQIEKSGEWFKIKLCQSSALKPSTSYATLSHVWGSGSPIRLLNNNLLRCQQDIPIVSLPQTFADAVLLTNILGLGYLWIDSLCIIQDSTLDWELESSTMCSVYRGSTLNIVASASVDCNGGLFRQRNPFLVTPCTIDVNFQNKAGARGRGPYALSCEIAFNRDPLADEPLGRRAWAVQERILAPRCLYFTARKIYFACREKITTDVDPYSFHGFRIVGNPFNFWGIDRPNLATSASELRLHLEEWQGLVQLYTHAQLSRESDKLVAIAGLAEHMQRTRLGPTITYLAGLWSHDLLDMLMWKREESLVSLARPKAYRAPTWSWASVEGEVEWVSDADYVGFPDQFYGASIVEAQTYPTGNPFGSVHGGYIQIRGRFCAWRDVAGVEPDWDVMITIGRNDRKHILAEPDCLILFILRVTEWEPSTSSSRPDYGVEGLILEYTMHKKGQYQRIGVFEDIDGEVLQASHCCRPAEHLYMEANEDNKYTIEII